jgi:predicted cupin superfamily sugar epimerase
MADILGTVRQMRRRVRQMAVAGASGGRGKSAKIYFYLKRMLETTHVHGRS